MWQYVDFSKEKEIVKDWQGSYVKSHNFWDITQNDEISALFLGNRKHVT